MNTSKTNDRFYTRFVPGENLIAKGVFLYRCPTCKKEFRYDDPYEPICTGPSENSDDHAPQIMTLVKRDNPKIVCLPLAQPSSILTTFK